jgi:DnaK suppressor protein
MDSRLIEELTALLYRQRASLLGSAVAANGQTPTSDERESEMEESAQIDLINRLKNHLDERDYMMIRQIDGALERVAAGTYGWCSVCEEEIAAARLRILPTTTLCIECAKTVEMKRSSAREEKANGQPTIYCGFEDAFYAEEETARQR